MCWKYTGENDSDSDNDSDSYNDSGNNGYDIDNNDEYVSIYFLRRKVMQR